MRPKNGLLKKALVFSGGIAVFQLGLCLAASLPAGTGNLLGDNGFELSEPNAGFDRILADKPRLGILKVTGASENQALSIAV